MPRLVKIWFEAESGGVFDEPEINRSFDLNGAVFVFGYHRFAADVNVERASGKMRTVADGESGAS